MATNDVITFNALSGNGPQKELVGGRYLFAVAAATFNAASVVVQMLAPDGVTFVNTPLTLSALGSIAGDLPRGQYRIACNAATGVLGSVGRVPLE